MRILTTTILGMSLIAGSALAGPQEIVFRYHGTGVIGVAAAVPEVPELPPLEPMEWTTPLVSYLDKDGDGKKSEADRVQVATLVTNMQAVPLDFEAVSWLAAGRCDLTLQPGEEALCAYELEPWIWYDAESFTDTVAGQTIDQATWRLSGSVFKDGNTLAIPE